MYWNSLKKLLHPFWIFQKYVTFGEFKMYPKTFSNKFNWLRSLVPPRKRTVVCNCRAAALNTWLWLIRSKCSLSWNPIILIHSLAIMINGLTFCSSQWSIFFFRKKSYSFRPNLCSIFVFWDSNKYITFKIT